MQPQLWMQAHVRLGCQWGALVWSLAVGSYCHSVLQVLLRQIVQGLGYCHTHHISVIHHCKFVRTVVLNCRYFFCQIVLSLEYCHTHHVAHRDLRLWPPTLPYQTRGILHCCTVLNCTAGTSSVRLCRVLSTATPTMWHTETSNWLTSCSQQTNQCGELAHGPRGGGGGAVHGLEWTHPSPAGRGCDGGGMGVGLCIKTLWQGPMWCVAAAPAAAAV